MAALHGVTRYGLNDARNAILRGSLKHTFFPSPVELRQQCDAAMEWHIQEERRVRQREEQQAETRRIAEFEATRTPESRQRVTEIMERFNASHDRVKNTHFEAERAEVRARYGMTPECLAGIRDQPSSFDQVGSSRKST